MVSYGTSVYYLGTETLYQSTINSWLERIEIALCNGHEEALKLALTFYDGSAKAVVGELKCYLLCCTSVLRSMFHDYFTVLDNFFRFSLI